MIYGELGVTPLYVEIQKRIVSFWCKLIDNYENNKLSSLIYNLVYEMHMQKRIKSQWIESIKAFFCSQGFAGIWYSQSYCNSKWLVKAIHQKLNDVFIQKWSSALNMSSSSNIYKIYKTTFEQSNYINVLSPILCKYLMSYRTRNHRLPVEVGRWQSIPLNERLCSYCKSDIGDEYHYLLVCNNFENERSKFVKTYYYKHPNTIKFQQLINTKDENSLKNLCRFINIIMKTVR